MNRTVPGHAQTCLIVLESTCCWVPAQLPCKFFQQLCLLWPIGLWRPLHRPLRETAHYNLASAFWGQGKLDDAIAEYREAIRLNPNDAGAHNNLASAFQDQDKLDDAIVEYREAIRIDPNLAEPHYLLGEALRQQGDRAGSARELRNFLRLAPSSPASQEQIERARNILLELEK